MKSVMKARGIGSLFYPKVSAFVINRIFEAWGWQHQVSVPNLKEGRILKKKLLKYWYPMTSVPDCAHFYRGKEVVEIDRDLFYGISEWLCNEDLCELLLPFVRQCPKHVKHRLKIAKDVKKLNDYKFKNGLDLV